MSEIVQWSAIKEQFQGNLLVGNGGSIALSRKFSYSSLYEYAKDKNLLKPEAVAIFDKFQKKILTLNEFFSACGRLIISTKGLK